MTTKIKVIYTKQDYEEALKLIEELMINDPIPDSDDGEKLNLLSVLIRDYESKTVPESLPDPVDAILFRIEQENLKTRDLIPYLGSKSKVSEILSRKRPLTLSMIRSLETGLGIPAKVLLKEPDEFREDNISWTRFPIREMEKRGYFGDVSTKKIDIDSAMKRLFQPVGSPSNFLGMLRKSNYRTVRPLDKHALVAWSAFVTQKAKKVNFSSKFKKHLVTPQLMRQIAQLSQKDDGPVLAREYLHKCGILLVIEPHLPQTYLDGATIMIDRDHPIIGLTIRYDRLDNFWFTLLHELAHISLHSEENINFFYDDLDNSVANDDKEKEADELASEALIPESKWESSPARLIPSPIAAESLAKELGIHVSVVAGKMRRENDRYQYLNAIINQSKVRKYFPEQEWPR